MREPGAERVRGRGVDRLLDILECLERADRPMSVKEIAASLAAPKSTLYLLVEMMAARDYLEALPNGRYQLGSRLGWLGMAFGRQASFTRIARRQLALLAAETRMIAELVVVDNWIQFVPMAVNEDRSPYTTSSEGARFPLPRTASARFLLAGFAREDILRNIPPEHYLLPNGERLTPEGFLADIEATRGKPVYIARGWVDPHVTCIAAPLLAPGGDCPAALSLVMPLHEIDSREEELCAAILAAARHLSEQLRIMPFHHA